MKKTLKHSVEVKIKACKEYEAGNSSYLALAKKLGVADTTMRLWYLKYKEYGPSVFEPSKKIRSFSMAFKVSVLEEYESGKHSISDLAVKYNLSKGVISRWLEKWYNNGIGIKDSLYKGDTYIMKKRKTTLEERLEIVKWIIDNDMDYKGAANKFALNYALVYKWTRAYQTNGQEALRYKKRGPKPKRSVDETGLTEVDQLKIALEKEKSLRKRRELELEVLKKKEEFEQKIRYQK